jgi:hypothetical protein
MSEPLFLEGDRFAHRRAGRLHLHGLGVKQLAAEQLRDIQRVERRRHSVHL